MLFWEIYYWEIKKTSHRLSDGILFFCLFFFYKSTYNFNNKMRIKLVSLKIICIQEEETDPSGRMSRQVWLLWICEVNFYKLVILKHIYVLNGILKHIYVKVLESRTCKELLELQSINNAIKIGQNIWLVIP